jgi:UDP-N-acetylglucosamine 1-carboxyvinyltransferase
MRKQTMRKTSNWNRYFKEQMADPATRKLVDEELRALRVGVQLAKLRQHKGLTQTQLAAKVGMSGPNISRIEASPSQNMTLQTMVRLFRALDHDVSIVPLRRRTQVRARRSTKAQSRS